ncbi:MAG: hypothetical protein FP826_09915 [Sphingomonadales bacterium]|nr:hypothetical protein [Sphingomonadales bacterium]MBU3992516.1 acyl-CoA/acyl-ACP dehydrogenase [Alphaproteobacteria bacterium]
MTQANETAELLSMVESSATLFLDDACSRAPGTNTFAELWREIVEMGLPLVALPEDRGGSGLGAAGFTCVARQFGRALVAQPYIACGVAPVAAIAALPDGAFSDAALALVADGTFRLAFGAKQSQAPLLAGGRLSGQWKLIAHPATHLMVAAGDALCLVALDGAGIIIEPHKALDGGEIATVSLTEAVPLQVEQGPAAARAGAVALAASRLAHAALLGGLAESAFRQTQDYIKTRAQFGQTIASFQSIQHRSVDQFIANSLTEASVEAAATAFDADPAAPATAALIAAALARASTGAAHVARESVQMHGAIGFTAEADVGRYVRALTGLANFHGTARDNRRQFAQFEDAA